MKFSVIVAINNTRGIAKNGKIPQYLPKDLKYFKETTTKTKNPLLRNVVVMGRRTQEAIPAQLRPLSNRYNIVLSTQSSGLFVDEIEQNYISTTKIINGNIDTALKQLSSPKQTWKFETVFMVGGSSIYRDSLNHFDCQNVYITQINSELTCDTWFPDIKSDKRFECKQKSETCEQNGLSFYFSRYERVDVENSDISSIALLSNGHTSNPEEQQYLDLIRDIIEHGQKKSDRTGTGTLSKFGCTMRFSLRDNRFPLLTTKRVFWRGVAEELLQFIKGKTNSKLLSEKGIHIWDGNGSREFLDQLGFKEREEGDLGPVYGFQQRHFGASYIDMHTDYSGQGFDQLRSVIDKLKSNPDDRRILMSAQNPADLHLMALPPCHVCCQFYVANDELSCLMFQRSCDMGLGVPFNIASYSLLTRLIAQVCNLKAGEFVHVLGDAHVYLNHVEPLREQLKRSPRPFPILKINDKIRNIDEFKYEDFTIEGYKPYKKIPMEMAV